LELIQVFPLSDDDFLLEEDDDEPEDGVGGFLLDGGAMIVGRYSYHSIGDPILQDNDKN
jgi:hypothetical protein